MLPLRAWQFCCSESSWVEQKSILLVHLPPPVLALLLETLEWLVGNHNKSYESTMHVILSNTFECITLLCPHTYTLSLEWLFF